MTDYPESSLKLRREQRKFFRYPVEGAAMLAVRKTGAAVACQMIDLGLEGCRLRRPEEFAAELGLEVEISFRLAGANFRFAGTLQWAARNRVLGVQFRQMSAARRQELAELLGDLREELEAGELERQHSGKRGGEKPAAAAKPKRERRTHERHDVDSRASIHFLALHRRMVGRTMDVSMGGCRIRAHDRLPVGAFRRVEVEFAVDGMPLLLPGVTQAIHDVHTIGIRFVELTERKRQQLSAVIEELKQLGVETLEI